MMRNKTPKQSHNIGLFKNQSGYKISSLVFGVVVVVGLVWAGINVLTKDNDLAATNVDGTPLVIPGWWFSDNFGVSVCEGENCQPDADPDKDKLTNIHEYFYHSNPNNPDTNGNGLTDGEDVAFGYAPDRQGKVTFDQIASDENIIGESLLFDKEVKDLIVNMSDFSKVALPEIKDSELTILESGGYDAFVDYMLALDAVSKKYSSVHETLSTLGEQIKQQNSLVINETKLMAARVREDYRKIPVPREAVQLHKYHLALWGILPAVLTVPTQDLTPGSMADVAANKWYDNAQIMISLNQKMEIEMQKLKNQYSK